MTITEAKEIREELKRFWKNLEIITTLAAERNKTNGNNYSWQYYEGCSGEVANYTFFPEITNCKVVAYLTKDTESKLYPAKDTIKDFEFVLNYKPKI